MTLIGILIIFFAIISLSFSELSNIKTSFTIGRYKSNKFLCLNYIVVQSRYLEYDARLLVPSFLPCDSPFAISSAFTNSLQFSISGRMVYDAVVLPAPLQPAMRYKLWLCLVDRKSVV